MSIEVDTDWRVRSEAVRCFVRRGVSSFPAVVEGIVAPTVPVNPERIPERIVAEIVWTFPLLKSRSRPWVPR